MSSPADADPFTEGQLPQQNANAQPQVPLHANPEMTHFYGNPQANAPYPNAVYGNHMGHPAYGNAYNPNYASPYGAYNTGYNPGYPRQPFAQMGQMASNARETSTMVLTSMHDAMARFARVSSMIEDVLRNLHMLFDAVFGLGYSLGAFQQEARLWMAIKTGPVGVVARVLRRALSIWRLLCLFFVSPLAGRFSPVALVLRILGLVPEEDPLEVSLMDLWRQREGEGGEGEDGADSSL